MLRALRSNVFDKSASEGLFLWRLREYPVSVITYLECGRVKFRLYLLLPYPLNTVRALNKLLGYILYLEMIRNKMQVSVAIMLVYVTI